MIRKIIRKIKSFLWKNKKRKIKEEMKVHEEWYEEASNITPEELPAFIDKLTIEYEHDYGTICHACAAAAVAAAWAVNNSKQGGITGFQAGAVMWEFIKNWKTEYDGKPLRLINYEKLLYPAYDDNFNTISQETWEWLKNEAKRNLENNDDPVHPDVEQRWKDIAIHEQIPAGLKVKGE